MAQTITYKIIGSYPPFGVELALNGAVIDNQVHDMEGIYSFTNLSNIGEYSVTIYDTASGVKTGTKNLTTTLTPPPNFGSGFSTDVDNIIETSDNKYLSIGPFIYYNGNAKNRIVRLNTDGSVDNSFNIGSGFNDAPKSLIETSNNKYLIGGVFINYNGNAKNRIIRLNTDGSVDNSFNIGSGFDFSLSSIIETSDNKYLIGGQFTNYNGNVKNRIIRLNTDGSVDNSFNIGSGFNTSVWKLIETSDNKYLIGGQFTDYNGNVKYRIVRLNTDGSVDNSFNIGSGFDGTVLSIIETSDNKYLIGGQFTDYNGNAKNRIVRLNTDGSVDNSFNIGSGFDSFVWELIETSDNKYLIGGQFTNYNGNAKNRIIRLNTDGSVDNSFNIGSGFNDAPKSLIETSDNKYLISGQFTDYNGSDENRIILLNTDGSIYNQ